ncbi:ABC transporter ATP-binding protein [Inquilinus sp. CA228]|uniref:ABC transporter ATP-binding protein n=1 Tax=Inquilinus sp. CA228 TaxID=3455609 RepID=UPI003F8CFC01
MIGPAPVYTLRNVVLRRGTRKAGFELNVSNLVVPRSEILFLNGQSGSGKSTLLDLLAGTLAPDRAETFELAALGRSPLDLAALWRRRRQDALAAVRASSIGYVLQTGGLLPYLSVVENIALTARLAGRYDSGHVHELADRLGLSRLLGLRPDRLSVGERQRVAIARALAHRPDVLLADEPTASLDPPTADRVFALLVETVERFRTTAVIASHDWSRTQASGRRIIGHALRREDDVVRAYFWT